MSEQRMRNQRYQERRRFMRAFTAWLRAEPPMWQVRRWRRWKAHRPTCKAERWSR